MNFTVSLSPDQQDRLRVVAFKEKGKIIGFVAQYEALIEQQWRQIVRYDTAHGFAQKDVIHPSGETVKQPLPFFDFNMVLHSLFKTLRHPGVVQKGL